MKNFVKRSSAVVGALLFVPAVYAAGPYDSLTAAVDWSDVSDAAIAVAALIAAVFVVIRGVRIILSMIKR